MKHSIDTNDLHLSEHVDIADKTYSLYNTVYWW